MACVVCVNTTLAGMELEGTVTVEIVMAIEMALTIEQVEWQCRSLLPEFA